MLSFWDSIPWRDGLTSSVLNACTLHYPVCLKCSEDQLGQRGIYMKYSRLVSHCPLFTNYVWSHLSWSGILNLFQGYLEIGSLSRSPGSPLLHLAWHLYSPKKWAYLQSLFKELLSSFQTIWMFIRVTPISNQKH